MQRAGWVLSGFLIGVLLMMAVPSTAHHRDSTRVLNRRVTQLEDRMSEMELHGLPDRMNDVEAKTIWLGTDDGIYRGAIENWQVFSNPAVCGHADDAVWVNDPTDTQEEAVLGCVRGTYP